MEEIAEYLAGAAHIPARSQRRGEPALTHEQRREIFMAALTASPQRALYTHGSELPTELLEHFRACEDDSVLVTLAGILASRRSRKVDVKNRRYEHMQKLLSEGEYFSMEEMQQRAPWLYEQFVGKHFSARENQMRAQKIAAGTWSEQLMAHMASNRAGVLQDTEEGISREQRERGHMTFKEDEWKMPEEEDEEEEEEEEDEEEEEGGSAQAMPVDKEEALAVKRYRQLMKIKAAAQRGLRIERDEVEVEEEEGVEDAAAGAQERQEEDEQEEEEILDDEEKERLKEDFLEQMKARFLRGEDSEFFDYSSIDNDAGLDRMDIRARDEEEAYFDEDEGY